MANNNIQYAMQHMLSGYRRQLAQDVIGDLMTCFMGCHSMTNGRVTLKYAMNQCGGMGRAIKAPVMVAEFPVSWHEPGTEIVGSRAAITTKTLTADQILHADVAVATEEYYTAYGSLRPGKKSVPVPYISALETAICRALDMQSFILMIRAARGHYENDCDYPHSPRYVGRSGYGNSCGQEPVNAPQGAEFQTAEGVARKWNYAPEFRLPLLFTEEDIMNVFSAAAFHFDSLGWPGTWDEKGGLKRDVTVYVSPYVWNRMLSLKVFMDTQFGGLGSYALGTLKYGLGFDIVNTPNLPSWKDVGVETFSPSILRRHFLDLTPPIHAGRGTISGKYAVENPMVTAMLFVHRKAIGRIIYDNVSYLEDFSPRRLSTLGLAYTMTGGGILCAEGVIEVAYENPPFLYGRGCGEEPATTGYNAPVGG